MIVKRVLLCTNFVADFVVGNVFFSVKFCFSIAAFFHLKQFTKYNMAVFTAGVNKKPKKFKTVWHGFREILKLSGRVNQVSLKLSAGFSNTVC